MKPPAIIRAVPATREESLDPILLDFQSPSEGVLGRPVPLMARATIWLIVVLFFACLLPMGLIPIDKVVTAQGKVVSQAPTIVVQPLETAIVKSIDVQEGQSVHKGDILALLDPTFTRADRDALKEQVAGLHAEVSRLQAEADNVAFEPQGDDQASQLQEKLYQQRQAERFAKVSSFDQKISGLVAMVNRAQSEADAYRQRLGVAKDVEGMRNELEKLKVGSRLNSLAAKDSRLEVMRGMETAQHTAENAEHDLASAVAERSAYEQQWLAEVYQKLADQRRALDEAQQNLTKAELRSKLVELRADQDSTVLSVSKVSVGSVLQSGDQFLTLVPTNVPIEIEANISGRDSGFVHVGDEATIKFDTFPYQTYGVAKGIVRTLSADSFTASDDNRSRHGTGAVPIPAGSTEPFFRARIAVHEVDLHDVPSGFRVAPGMPVEADVKVGKRTVLSYLLGRVMPIASEGMREP